VQQWFSVHQQSKCMRDATSCPSTVLHALPRLSSSF